MKLAVCLIVKNEERYIREWVDYHIACGFDTIFIYDNRSTDQTESIVREASVNLDLRYKLWEDETPFYQKNAYDDCIAIAKSDCDWVAFIDSDEFICMADGHEVRDFLSGFQSHPAIAVNWLIFGSSGHIQRPSGSVVRNFTQRSEVSFGPNRHVKSIVQPSRTTCCINPHVFDVEGAYVDVAGDPVDWEILGLSAREPRIDPMRINHYFTRSLEDWQAKLRRGYHDTERHEEHFQAYDRNEIEDTLAKSFVDRKKLFL